MISYLIDVIKIGVLSNIGTGCNNIRGFKGRGDGAVGKILRDLSK